MNLTTLTKFGLPLVELLESFVMRVFCIFAQGIEIALPLSLLSLPVERLVVCVLCVVKFVNYYFQHHQYMSAVSSRVSTYVARHRITPNAPA